MGLLSIEHRRAAYLADFALYAAVSLLLATLLVTGGPPGRALELGSLAVLGLGGWTAAEYAVHRFVLHGLQPFRRWHAEHHRRPTALIFTPTIVSAALIGSLVWVPAWLALGAWPACALSLGLLAGYLAYAITHHAIHHWRSDSAWLKRRKRWHARHHRACQPCCFGVTSAFWDQLFGSTGRPRSRPAPASGPKRRCATGSPL